MFKEYLINNLSSNLGSINSDEEIMENCGNILKNIGLGKETDVCFNYALKNKKLDYVEEGVEFLRKNKIIKKLFSKKVVSCCGTKK